MNVAVYAINSISNSISWQSAIRAALKTSNLNQLLKDLTIIFLIGTKCKINFIYMRSNCKRKKGYTNVWGKVPLHWRGGEGGSQTPYRKCLNFVQFFLLPS